jgi:hypothetical protein
MQKPDHYITMNKSTNRPDKNSVISITVLIIELLLVVGGFVLAYTSNATNKEITIFGGTVTLSSLLFSVLMLFGLTVVFIILKRIMKISKTLSNTNQDKMH